MDEDDLKSIEEPHQPDYDSIGGCVCGESYPCTTRGLVAEVRRLRVVEERAARLEDIVRDFSVAFAQPYLGEATEQIQTVDPVLNDLAKSGQHPQLVYTTNLGANVPTWHRQSSDEGPDCGTVDPLVLTSPLHVMHARRIGIACREDGCFPDE